MFKHYFVFFSFLFISIFSSSSFAEESLNVAPAPSWVTPTSLLTSSFQHLDQIQNGVNYQLLDIQLRVPKDSEQVEFRRYVEDVRNRQGLNESSQINLYFSPEYERLTLHWLKIYRGDQEIDKTSSARISLLQRENELDDLVYNGEKNYYLILDDVRVGDVIDYAYSVVGANPVYQSVFGYGHKLSWMVPVQKLSLRLLWEKPAELYSQLKNTDLKLTSKIYPLGIEYHIQDEHVPSVIKENDSPSWYKPWASIRFSEAKNWSEVSDWGQTLYVDAYESNSSIESKVAEIRQKYDKPTDQVQAALRFVQDEIRYLGLEMGENSHRPTQAFTTFERRYGDCKDKTVLLITLLKKLGFDAYPALVNTEMKFQLEDSLASARNFDHVITYMEFDNKKWWLDPTRSYQYGSLESIHQTDYGYALILKPGTDSLTQMNPTQSLNGLKTVDSYFLSVDVNKAISVSLDNTYRGLNAERQREAIDNQGTNQLQKSYLEYLRYYYPTAEVAAALNITDDKQNNTVQIEERYSVGSMWTQGDKDGTVETSFYPYLVNDVLSVPDDINRVDPLSISYPKNISQTINVYFESDDWSLRNDSFTESNDFFNFEYSARYDKENKALQLNYTYSSKVSYVEPERYGEYVTSLNKTQHYLNYGIYKPVPPIVSSGSFDISANDEASEGVFSIIVALIYLLVLLWIIILWRLDRLNSNDGMAGIYYPVSLSKFIFMLVFTLGTYGNYWFYKNFQYIKHRDGSKIMPFFRGVFCCVWYYSLWCHLQKNNKDLKVPLAFIGKKTAIIYSLFFCVLAVLSGINESWLAPILLLSVYFVLPILNLINSLNVSDIKPLIHNSQWKFRHILLGLVMLPIILFSLVQESGLIPNGKVVKGKKLWTYQKQTMIKKGIISPNDEIKYFYSDASLLMREDGNGITQRHVFSYWRVGSNTQIEFANFDQIDSIEVANSGSLLGNSTVTVNRKDGSGFTLILSNEDEKNKLFIAELRSHLN
tara:strand:+ start:339 stop:3317 length:2979 start_codon:yes stop_codon:yes gene_type:complete